MTRQPIGLPERLPMRIVSIVLAIAFLATCGMKVVSVPKLVANCETDGYPAGSHTVVGAAEIIGAVGLFVRPVAKDAAFLLVSIAVGAVSMHLPFPPIQRGIPALILLRFSAYPGYQYIFVPKSDADHD